MATEILRPNAAGDYTALTISGTSPAPTNWQSVDEETSDSLVTLVIATSTTQVKDAYNLGASSIPENSIINSVKVYLLIRCSSYGYNPKGQPYLRLGTAETAGTEITGNGQSWVTVSEALSRPGGGTWSIADLTNLQVAIGLRSATAGKTAQCTQVYVEIDYTAGGAFEPRYGFVNFQDPGIL